MVGPFRQLLGCLGGCFSSRGGEAAWALAPGPDQCLWTSDPSGTQAPPSCLALGSLHRPQPRDESPILITVEVSGNNGAVAIGGSHPSLANLLDYCWAPVKDGPDPRWTACLDRLHQVSCDGGGRSGWGLGKERWQPVMGPEMRGNHPLTVTKHLDFHATSSI